MFRLLCAAFLVFGALGNGTVKKVPVGIAVRSLVVQRRVREYISSMKPALKIEISEPVDGGDRFIPSDPVKSNGNPENHRYQFLSTDGLRTEMGMQFSGELSDKLTIKELHEKLVYLYVIRGIAIPKVSRDWTVFPKFGKHFTKAQVEFKQYHDRRIEVIVQPTAAESINGFYKNLRKDAKPAFKAFEILLKKPVKVEYKIHVNFDVAVPKTEIPEVPEKVTPEVPEKVDGESGPGTAADGSNGYCYYSCYEYYYGYYDYYRSQDGYGYYRNPGYYYGSDYSYY